MHEVQVRLAFSMLRINSISNSSWWRQDRHRNIMLIILTHCVPRHQACNSLPTSNSHVDARLLHWRTWTSPSWKCASLSLFSRVAITSRWEANKLIATWWIVFSSTLSSSNNAVEMFTLRNSPITRVAPFQAKISSKQAFRKASIGSRRCSVLQIRAKILVRASFNRSNRPSISYSNSRRWKHHKSAWDLTLTCISSSHSLSQCHTCSSFHLSMLQKVARQALTSIPGCLWKTAVCSKHLSRYQVAKSSPSAQV